MKCACEFTLEEVKLLRKLTSLPYIQDLWPLKDAHLAKELTEFFDTNFLNNGGTNEREDSAKSN